jgi:hypothetical protein
MKIVTVIGARPQFIKSVQDKQDSVSSKRTRLSFDVLILSKSLFERTNYINYLKKDYNRSNRTNRTNRTN